MNIGSNIKKIRKEKHILQKEFKEIGISQSYLSEIESNKTSVTVEMAANIADFLGVHLYELLGLSVDESNFLYIFKNLDKSFDLDIMKIKVGPGNYKYGIIMNDDEIQKKLQIYKLMKELKSSPDSSDKEIFKGLLQ